MAASGLRWLSWILLCLAVAPLSRGAAQTDKPEPRITVPPPAATAMSAAPYPAARATDVVESRLLTGWMPAFAKHKFVGFKGQKIAIIDSGFEGIHAWLAANPPERNLVTYLNDQGPGKDPGHHGFDVLRVARAVIDDAQFLLYRVKNLGELLKAVDEVAKRGAVIANVSLGFLNSFEVAAPQPRWERYFHDLLRQRQIFVLFAAGNERQTVHSWTSADSDGNGLVDLRPPVAGSTNHDRMPIQLIPGRDAMFRLGWDRKTHPSADYAIEIIGQDGHVIATAARDPKRPDGLAVLTHKAVRRSAATVRIRRLSGPSSGVFMRFGASRVAIASRQFNGLQSIPSYAFQENPFLIFVGAAGKGATGKIAPSAFSNVGHTADGRALPHIYGPGQITLDGKTYDGTSFAAPFVTAVYGMSFGYNIKNLMQRNATFARFEPDVPGHLRSRWGAPDMFKVWGGNLKILVGKTKIENVRHEVRGEDLVVKLDITRCCMEGMSWHVVAGFYDAATKAFVKTPDGKMNAVAGAWLLSDKPDYARHPVELKVPLKALVAAKGRTVSLVFDVYVPAWRNAYKSYVKVDEAPVYRLTL